MTPICCQFYCRLFAIELVLLPGPLPHRRQFLPRGMNPFKLQRRMLRRLAHNLHTGGLI